MPSTTKSQQSIPTRQDLLRIVGIILAILGLGVAAYMSWSELSGIPTTCPGHSGDGALAEPGQLIVDCGFVQNSIYAKAFGIPVAVLGLAGYLVILAIWLLENSSNLIREYSALVVFGLALFGLLFSLYLTYTELFIMYTICTWCVTSAVLMTAIFIIAAVRLYRHMQRPI